jgi:hypothetical protein
MAIWKIYGIFVDKVCIWYNFTRFVPKNLATLQSSEKTLLAHSETRSTLHLDLTDFDF